MICDSDRSCENEPFVAFDGADYAIVRQILEEITLLRRQSEIELITLMRVITSQIVSPMSKTLQNMASTVSEVMV